VTGLVTRVIAKFDLPAGTAVRPGQKIAVHIPLSHPGARRQRDDAALRRSGLKLFGGYYADGSAVARGRGSPARATRAASS
jgi:hypothetical protein